MGNTKRFTHVNFARVSFALAADLFALDEHLLATFAVGEAHRERRVQSFVRLFNEAENDRFCDHISDVVAQRSIIGRNSGG